MKKGLSIFIAVMVMFLVALPVAVQASTAYTEVAFVPVEVYAGDIVSMEGMGSTVEGLKTIARGGWAALYVKFTIAVDECAGPGDSLMIEADTIMDNASDDLLTATMAIRPFIRGKPVTYLSI